MLYVIAVRFYIVTVHVYVCCRTGIVMYEMTVTHS